MSTKLKRYSEEFVENLYKKEYWNENDDGVYFPKNEIVINLVNYSGEYEDRKTKKAVPYEGQKVKIINYALTMEQGQTIHKKKINWDYITDDKKEMFMTLEQFDDLKEAIRLKDNESWVK